jgi:hypothetical protein
MLSMTDTAGNANHYTQVPGRLDYTLFKKGYISKTNSFNIQSDTVIQDTMKAAINAYRLDIEVKESEFSQNLSGCKILLNETEKTSNAEGIASFDQLSYGFYNLQISYPGYTPFELNAVEIYSDSLIQIKLDKQYFKAKIKVVDKVSGIGIVRAFIYLNDEIWLTDAEGFTLIDKLEEGISSYRIEHSDYFMHEGSIDISGDTSATVLLTNTRADILFQIESNQIPLENATIVLLDTRRQTESTGIITYHYLPARKQYNYTVEKEGYYSLNDSIFLEIDTIVNINLDPITYSHAGSLQSAYAYPNPASDLLTVICDTNSSKLTLYDIYGKMLFEENNVRAQSELDMESMPRGFYFLEVSHLENVSVIKIVKR